VESESSKLFEIAIIWVELEYKIRTVDVESTPDQL